MPMVSCAATRIPVRMIGQAIGSCTFRRTENWFIPMPIADSMTAGGTSRRPTTVLRTIGSSEYMTRAMTVGVQPRPKAGISRASIASDGMVSATAAAVITIDRGTGRSQTSMPIPTPMIVAISNETATTEMCSTTRPRMSGARVSQKCSRRLKSNSGTDAFTSLFVELPEPGASCG